MRNPAASLSSKRIRKSRYGITVVSSCGRPPGNYERWPCEGANSDFSVCVLFEGFLFVVIANRNKRKIQTSASPFFGA